MLDGFAWAIFGIAIGLLAGLFGLVVGLAGAVFGVVFGLIGGLVGLASGTIGVVWRVVAHVVRPAVVVLVVLLVAGILFLGMFTVHQMPDGSVDAERVMRDSAVPTALEYEEPAKQDPGPGGSQDLRPGLLPAVPAGLNDETGDVAPDTAAADRRRRNCRYGSSCSVMSLIRGGPMFIPRTRRLSRRYCFVRTASGWRRLVTREPKEIQVQGKVRPELLTLAVETLHKTHPDATIGFVQADKEDIGIQDGVVLVRLYSPPPSTVVFNWARVDVFAPKGIISEQAQFKDVPWLSNFAAFANQNRKKTYMVAISQRPATSEQESRQEAMRLAVADIEPLVRAEDADPAFGYG